MALKYLHGVGAPVVDDAAVGCAVEDLGAASVVKVDHTRFRVVTVDPANDLQRVSEKEKLNSIVVTHAVHLLE